MNEEIEDILELCKEARSEVSVKVNKKSDVLNLLKKKWFSGIVRLSCNSEEVSDTILFDSGEIKLISIEEGTACEKEVSLDIYELPYAQMKNVYEIIYRTSERKPMPKIKPFAVANIEKALEAYKVIKDCVPVRNVW